mmetsp:Transcript_4844/g.5247  ORF Transcript_4844/g.5247 Transcript_4844/m.5247 type:complete len:278 (+) Transcript_4844:61-894(+)
MGDNDLSVVFNQIQEQVTELVKQKNEAQRIQTRYKQNADNKINEMMSMLREQIQRLAAVQKATNQRQKYNEEPCEVVTLNVGGVLYQTTTDTLCSIPGTMLEAMFSGRHAIYKDKEGHYFLDRDGPTFRHILNWLRTRSLPSFPKDVQEQLAVEADYFGITQLVESIRKQQQVKADRTFAVLRYNENTNYNNLSWQGLTQPVTLQSRENNCYQCIDEVLHNMHKRGWRLAQMSGESEGGWMFIFQEEKQSVGLGGSNNAQVGAKPKRTRSRKNNHGN